MKVTDFLRERGVPIHLRDFLVVIERSDTGEVSGTMVLYGTLR